MEAKVKEELPDKDYSLNNNDRRKAASMDHRSPEADNVGTSPTPGQPGPPSPQNNGTAEPLSPPLSETTRSAALQRLRRFLSALQQFATDSSSETAADRVRQYIHSLVAGTISVEEFCTGVAECTMYPLRASVPGFLRTLLPPAQAHLHLAARSSKLPLPQYLRLHEHQILETGGDPSDIFGPQPSSISDLGVKRRMSDALYDHPSSNGLHEDYQPAPKRPLTSGLLLNPPLLYPLPSNATLFDYNSYHGYHGQSDVGFERRDGGISVRDVSSMNASFGEPRTLASSAGLLKTDDEWKNINTMLNCILSMVEKTKRALAILQQRGVEPTESNDVKRVANEIMAAAVRQTEERVSEVRRRAEDAVNQVKRQALIELQRAVGAAEAKALELVAAERGKMERLLTERLQDRRTPPPGADASPNAAQQNCCWNCGRKAQETCSGCNSARYCGAFCQHKDWEHHHQVCSGRDQKPVTSQTSSPPATHPKPTTRSPTPINISDRHPTSSTERITINPERGILNPDRVLLNPDRLPINPDRQPINPERLQINPERLQINPERLQINPERLQINPDRQPINPDRLPINPERLQLSTEMIQLERIPQAENRLSLSSLNTAERLLSSTQDRSIAGNSERIALANLSTAQGLIGGVGGKK